MKRVILLAFIFVASISNIYSFSLGIGIGPSYGGQSGFKFSNNADRIQYSLGVGTVPYRITRTSDGKTSEIGYSFLVGNLFPNATSGFYGISYGVLGVVLEEITSGSFVSRTTEGYVTVVYGTSLVLGGSSGENQEGFYYEARYVIISDEVESEFDKDSEPLSFKNSILFSLGWNF